MYTSPCPALGRELDGLSLVSSRLSVYSSNGNDHSCTHRRGLHDHLSSTSCDIPAIPTYWVASFVHKADSKDCIPVRYHTKTPTATFEAPSHHRRWFPRSLWCFGGPYAPRIRLVCGCHVLLGLRPSYPAYTANYLMNTEDLDHGEFWMLKETPPALVVIGTTALTLFGFDYSALVAFMLCFRRRALQPPKSQAAVRPRSQSLRLSAVQPLSRRLSVKYLVNARRHTHHSGQSDLKQPSEAVKGQPTTRFDTLLFEFTSIQGAYHCYYNAFFDLPKLVFQTTSLITYLDKGFPLPLIYFFAALLLINWLISFYRFQRRAMDSKLVVTRLFYLFDLFFAVFAPMVVLAYAYYQFKMDRDEFDLRESALSPGSYDRIARLFADPVQVDVFRDGFANTQLTKTSYLIAKLCLNTLVLYKWKHIIVYLIQQQHLEAKQRQVGLKQPRASQIRLHGPQRKRHRFAGTVLFFSGIAFVVSYTIISITSSQRNCAPFQQCRVMSFEWHFGANDTACPCIVYIDRDLMPTTFDQWMNPIDATHELAEVARPGRLETVQIINRAVPTLPSELENCRSLQELILIYTKTQELPVWVKSFKHMHHLHVESNFLHYPLHILPLDLFSEMKQLRFMRFGGPAALQEFPSLQGLRQLTTFVLSLPHRLTALPAFDGLERLATLFVADATHVPRLPSLQPLKNLKSFSLLRRNAVCCNGFVTGRCDLTDFQCKPRVDEPVVECVSERIDPQDLQLINSVNHFLCSVNLTSDVSDSEPRFELTDTLCGGVKYRQCAYNGRTGICYNGRMQVLHCDIFGEYEKLRRLEIARGIGPPCDPVVEKWLGCKVTAN